MKLKELLSPEFQRRYDKALRDWEAGRNLLEAASIVYGTKSEQKLDRLVKLREGELAVQRQKCKRVSIAGLGVLTHDGEDFVGKIKTVIYPKSAVFVRVDPIVANDASIEQLWQKFRRRERTLLRELETAISKYYRRKRQLSDMTGGSPLPPLRRNSDIWNTLAKPDILFRRPRRNVVLLLA